MECHVEKKLPFAKATYLRVTVLPTLSLEHNDHLLSSIGKTSLLIRTANHQFYEDYIPTVFDNYTSIYDYRGETINVGWWDTAGGVSSTVCRMKHTHRQCYYNLVISNVALTAHLS